MEAEPALLCAYDFDPSGGLVPLGSEFPGAESPGEGFRWVHLKRTEPDSEKWLRETSGLSQGLCDALLAEETRPRLEVTEDGVLLILRGVNLNPGADPEDMVSIRIWSDGRRIISLRGPRVLAVSDIENALREGIRFRGPAELIASLAAGLIRRMEPVIDGLEGNLDQVEESLIDSGSPSIRARLGDIRKEAIALRRYLSPQRDVLARLSIAAVSWMGEGDRSRLRESTDRITRHVEDLEALRERAAVAQEELLARTQDRMNRNTYLLTLVAAVFLPLSFVTGLLGINVGGIPGSDSSLGFLVVCLLLLFVGAIELLFFYARRWF